MKDFIEWSKEQGQDYSEYQFTKQGRREFDSRKAARKRETKGTGDETCPWCEKTPCQCGTAVQKNRVRKHQKMEKD